MPPAFRKAAAMQEVKMFVVPKSLRRTIFGNGIIEALANRDGINVG
jgi:hypothetical protein